MIKRMLEGLNALVLLAMFLVTALQILFRVILRIPASWSEELAQYSFIFLVFLGSISLVKDEEHIQITFLVDRLGPRARRIVRILGHLLMIPMLAAFTIGAFENVFITWETGLPTVPWFRIGYMYLVVAFSGACMVVYLGQKLLFDLLGKEEPSVSSIGGDA